MADILIFAGTSEGRRLIEYFSSLNIHVTACVATEYGGELIGKNENVCVSTRRFNKEQMLALMNQNTYDFVIDATHPFARDVSENIVWACTKAKLEYIRILREKTAYKHCRYVDDYGEAAAYLNNTQGNILLTTGTKDLEFFTKIKDFENRIFVRILPMAEGIEKCLSLGIKPKNIICMQGPFSHEMNAATLKDGNIKFLVTKDSGESGGVEEKVSAAEETGASLIMIGRPAEQKGLTLEQAIELFNAKFNAGHIIKNGLPLKFPLFINIKDKKIVVVGAGKIAQRRIESLFIFSCDITVIADEYNEKIAQYQNARKLTFKLKKYDSNDLDEAFMVVAATDNRKVNHEIYLECIKKNLWCSIADRKEECNFYFPALIPYANGIIGICGNGENHNMTSKMAAYMRLFLKEEEYKNHEKN